MRSLPSDVCTGCRRLVPRTWLILIGKRQVDLCRDCRFRLAPPAQRRQANPQQLMFDFVLDTNLAENQK